MQQIIELQQAVDRLASESQQIRREMHRRTRVFIAAVLCGAIVIVAAVCAAFIVTLDNRQAIQENNQRWCPVVEPLVPRPGDPPPQGNADQRERSQRIRDAFTKLAKDFGCT